jgi:TPR repeat protein
MGKWRALGLLVIFAAIFATASWAYRGVELLQGKAAFAAKDFSRAAAKLKPFSGWGDAEAQAALGDMYANGLGLPEDDGKAFVLATKSANTGLSYAETLLGTLYEEGRGTPEDDTQAAFWFRQAALQGNADAETKLGEAYVKGIGVGQDYGQAATLFQQAADQADPVAQYDLGRLYVIGLGEPQDDGQAAHLFQTSADLGNLDARVNLGILYHEGAGVPQDDGRAVALFRPVAATGNAVAQYYLGVAYEKGEGVGADPAQAVAWLRRAAIQGDAAAQAALGQVFEQPGRMDAVLAYMLFDLAAGQGNVQARAEMDALANELTPAQLAKGQSLASQWDVNAPLPVTSFEDRAPQLVYGLSAPASVYQTSQIWFSRKFALAGQNFEATFVARPGKPCPGCGAVIGVATFRLDGNGAVVGSAGQADFTTFGASGAVPGGDPGATVQMMAADRLAILVPFTMAGLRDYAVGDQVFGFALREPADPASGAWSDLGKVTTESEHVAAGAASGNCATDATVSGTAVACAAWQGVISLVPVADQAWPDIAVKVTGTVLDVRRHPAAAADKLYRFNGKSYAVSPVGGAPKA